MVATVLSPVLFDLVASIIQIDVSMHKLLCNSVVTVSAQRRFVFVRFWVGVPHLFGFRAVGRDARPAALGHHDGARPAAHGR